MVANIALSLILVNVIGDPTTLERGPQGGLALANVLASSAEVPILLWLLRRRMGGIEGTALLASAGRLTLAAGAMGLVLWGLLHWDALAALPVLLFVPLAVAIGAAVYAAIAWLLGVEETKLARRLLRP
jgi:putative peptidoglycan lipid II flippase